MTRDLINNIAHAVSLTMANRTATTNGATVDTAGYESGYAAATAGTPGDTLSGTVKIEFEMQESADGTTWRACADTDIINPVGTANGATNTGCFALITSNGAAGQTYRAGYRGGARYLRVVDRRTGTHSTGTQTSATFALGHPHYAPVTGNAT